MRQTPTRTALAAALALLLPGCGKKAPAPVANGVETEAAPTILDNGTASDITAADATIGAEGNMAMSAPPPAPDVRREHPEKSARSDDEAVTEDKVPAAVDDGVAGNEQ